LVKFSQITNPYAVRDTSVFAIEVYKDYDSGTLSKKIIETATSTIPASLYTMGEIQAVNLAASNSIV